MKYLFHIHSFVNYVTALGVINLEKIDKKDVVFAVARGIKLNSEYQEFTIPQKIYTHPFNSLKKLHTCKWLNNRSIIAAIDALIDENTNKEVFQYFSPHSRGYLYQVFLTNPKCIAVNYIEDGGDAYMSRPAFERKFPFRIKWYQKFMRNSFFLLPVFQKKRLGMYDNPFKCFFSKPAKVYGLTARSFRSLDYIKAAVIDINSLTLRDIPTYKPETNLFLFDALIEQGVATFDLIEKFIQWFSVKYSKIDVLKIKFHPAQSQEMRKQISKVFENQKMKTDIISDKIPIELVCVNNKKLNIFGIGSSLLLYGTLFGKHTVNVLYPFFNLKHDYFSKRYKDWQDLYSKNKDVLLLGREINL